MILLNLKRSKIWVHNVKLASALIIATLTICDSKGCAKHFVVDIDCFANINLREGCTMKYRGGVVASAVWSSHLGMAEIVKG